MSNWLATAAVISRRMATKISAIAALLSLGAVSALAQPESAGGEASLKLPDLSSVSFFNGSIDGHRLLLVGILFCLGGLGFGMAIYMRLKNLPVHRAMDATNVPRWRPSLSARAVARPEWSARSCSNQGSRVP